MRTLGWEDVEDTLMGATILGCGGGGPLDYGTDLMRRLYDDERSVALASPEEIDDGAIIACPYGVGAMTTAELDPYGDRPRPSDHPSVLAVRALGAHVGREIEAIICGDLKRAFEAITEAASHVLAVERVSVWLLQEDRSAIQLADLYDDVANGAHSVGTVLQATRYPSSFQALQQED